MNVTTAGTYVLDARVASNGAGGTFHVEMDGTDITNTLTVPDTGGWQSWTTITSPSFSLTAGAHVLRIAMDTSSSVTSSIANFNFPDRACTRCHTRANAHTFRKPYERFVRRSIYAYMVHNERHLLYRE